MTFGTHTQSASEWGVASGGMFQLQAVHVHETFIHDFGAVYFASFKDERLQTILYSIKSTGNQHIVASQCPTKCRPKLNSKLQR